MRIGPHLSALAAAMFGSLGGAPMSDGLMGWSKPKRRVHLVHTQTVVTKALHRAPQWKRQVSAGGKVVREWMPNVVKEVPIRSAVFVDGSRNYRGRLGAKDQARRAAALAGAA